MVAPEHKLKLSFTALALGLRETEVALSVFDRSGDWKAAASMAVEENAFQLTSSASTRRVFREVRQRLEVLDPQTREAFVDGSADDRRSILLIAACKCYSFIFDFVRTMLANKVAVFDHNLSQSDFDAYWNQATLEHPELEDISESTRKKIRQVTFRLLAEAGLLTGTRPPRITVIPISPTVEAVLRREGDIYREAFLS